MVQDISMTDNSGTWLGPPQKIHGTRSAYIQIVSKSPTAEHPPTISGLCAKDKEQQAAAAIADEYRQLGWIAIPFDPEINLMLSDHHSQGMMYDEVDLWRRFPNANVGIICRYSNIVVLEFSYRVACALGKWWRTDETQQSGPPTFITYGGTVCMLFRQEDSYVARGQLPIGVRVHSNDDIVPFPPSIDRNGNRCRWVSGRDHKNGVLRPLPPGWYDLMMRSEPSRSIGLGPTDVRT